MQKSIIGLFAAATFFAGVVRAAEPSAAQDRETNYQSEVRAALTERGWRITGDNAGKLTAERRMTVQNASKEFLIGPDVEKRARLEITFRADGKNHTATEARASYAYYDPFRTDRIDRPIYPPFALRDPKLTQEYRDIVAEAETHLAATHHRYAADPNRVAMK